MKTTCVSSNSSEMQPDRSRVDSGGSRHDRAAQSVCRNELHDTAARMSRAIRI